MPDDKLTKRRFLYGDAFAWSNKIYGNQGASGQSKWIAEVQRVNSQNHPGYKNLDANVDTGGFFDSWKSTVTAFGTPVHSRFQYEDGWGWRYDTKEWLVPSRDLQPYAAHRSNFSYGNWAIDSFLDGRVPTGLSYPELVALGVKAIAAVKPTNPTVDLATTLAELWSERKFFSVPGTNSSVSGEYLNYQFGIAPTMGDFQDLRDAIENRDAIIRQYQRDAKKIIRRKFDWEPSTSVEKTTEQTPAFPMGESGLNTYQNPGGLLMTTTTTTQRSWFSGAFKYSIPQGSFPSTLAELDRLYGVKPGLSTAYELVPFSWLVDYFTPIGSLLDNIDSFLMDGLVLPYGYLMTTTEVEKEYSWVGPICDASGTLTPTALFGRIKNVRKQRIPATPFGFGLLPGDLSPKQLSILAALGMSMRK